MDGSTLRFSILLLSFFLSWQISFSQNYGLCDCVTLGNCPVPINDNGSFSTSIPVSLPGPDDLAQCPLEQVCITITHTWIGDLSVSLTSPAGVKYLIMADVNNNFGGCGMQEDNMEVCIVPGNFNPPSTNSSGDLAEYICTPGPCNAGNGTCCMTGEYTLPCGGVTDPVNGALEAPNCDLNDFNVPGHPVNGIWTLTVVDVCNMDFGLLENFSLSFACSDFIDTSTCFSNGGYFRIQPINVCVGDPALEIDASPRFCQGIPSDSLYGYVFLISKNDTILSVSTETDLTAFPPGNYKIYGLSFENQATAQVAALEGQLLQDVLALFQNDNAPFCGGFSADFIEVNIDPDPLTVGCADIWVDAGADTVMPCGGNVKLVGNSMFDVNSECVAHQWERLDGGTTTIGPQVFANAPGPYVFSFVHSGSNCTVSDTVVVSSFVEHSAEIIGTDTIYECRNAELDLVGTTDGQGTFKYTWYNLATSQTIGVNKNVTVTESGTYMLRVRKNVTDCSSYDTVTVLFSSPFIEGIIATEADCDVANGTASVLLTPNASNISFEWSNGGQTETITDLASGWYAVTIDDGSCEVEESIEVKEDLSCKVVMRGHIFNDHFDQDCAEDNISLGVECIMLHLLPDDIYTYSQPDGSYEFIAYPGNHTIEYVDEDEYELLCPSTAAFSFDLPDGGAVSEANDFFVRKETGQNLKISLTKGAARPGFYQNYYLRYQNLSTDPVDAMITFVHDALLEDHSLLASAGFYDPDNQTAIWAVNNIPPGGENTIFFKMYLPPSVSIGTELTGSAKIEPIDIDTYPYDNTINWRQTVTGSYDPNEKSSHTGENQLGGIITENDTVLSYQILFQNTGTDTAFTVVIRDTLDEKLDVESIRPGMASHDYVLEFEGRNVLVFNFNNIMLPDSNINEPASHGYVTFTVKRDRDLMPNEKIENRAAIYFDYNEPIITNKTVHYILPPIYTINQTVQLCAGEMYNGEIYNESASLVDTIILDTVWQIIHTDINVISEVETEVEANICTGSIFQMGGQTFDAAGNYILNLKSTLGCDSTIYLTLVESENIEVELSGNICDGEHYLFNGEYINVSGEYSAGFLNANGCDSLVTLILNVLPNIEQNISEYICEGDSIEFGGGWLSQSGVYIEKYIAESGCDSLVQLELYVYQVWDVEEDTAVVVGSEIYGHTVWSDTTIVQELLDDNGCYFSHITNVSVFVNSHETNNNLHLQILPNPNRGQFILKGENAESGKYEIAIYNVFGQLVSEPFQGVYLNNKFELKIDNEVLTKGIYYLQLLGKENKAIIKFVVLD